MMIMGTTPKEQSLHSFMRIIYTCLHRRLSRNVMLRHLRRLLLLLLAIRTKSSRRGSRGSKKTGFCWSGSRSPEPKTSSSRGRCGSTKGTWSWSAKSTWSWSPSDCVHRVASPRYSCHCFLGLYFDFALWLGERRDGRLRYRTEILNFSHAMVDRKLIISLKLKGARERLSLSLSSKAKNRMARIFYPGGEEEFGSLYSRDAFFIS